MMRYDTYCRVRQAAEAGRTPPQIAAELGMHVQTVRKWLARERYTPSAGAHRPRPSKLDAHKGTLTRLIAAHAFTATQLWQRLRTDGYTGGYSILKDYVRRIRPKHTEAFLTLKFAPGQCAQVDWGSSGFIDIGGARRALSYFVFVLGHSRWLHVEFTLGQSQEWWLGCHQRAFEKLGGVPRELLVDNCKTAVLRHVPGVEPDLNPHYLDFARHHGFRIKACGPRHPQSKGIVENAVAYLQGNFLAGRSIHSLEELNAGAAQWLSTVANVREHAETRRRPLDHLAEERPHLQPLHPQPHPAELIRPVRASRRCRVTVDTNRYSVPAAQAGALLTLHLTDAQVRVYAEGTLVATHPRCYARHADLENPDHVQELETQKREGARQRLLLRFLELDPVAGPYHRALLDRRFNAGHHLARILELVPTHGQPAVAAVLRDAHQLGAYSSDYIVNLLEQRARLQPTTSAPALHLTHHPEALDLELPAPDLSPYTR